MEISNEPAVSPRGVTAARDGWGQLIVTVGDIHTAESFPDSLASKEQSRRDLGGLIYSMTSVSEPAIAALCFYDAPTPQNSWTASPRLRKPNPSCQNSLGSPGALATFRCAFPGGRKHSPGPLLSATDAGTASTAATVKPAIVLCMSYLPEVASNAMIALPKIARKWRRSFRLAGAVDGSRG